MSKILSFDIGGTGCQWILFDNLKPTNKGDFKTSGMKKTDVLNEIGKIVKSFNDSDLKIGISSPTAINTTTGYSYGLSAIEEYGNFNLYDELKKIIGDQYEIRATNDANAALLGSLFFEKELVNDAVLVSLGTGIGGAIYLNGNVIVGKNGFAGEFGYGMMMHKERNVSQNLSTYALTRRINEQHAEELTGKEIWTRFKDGEFTDVVNEWISLNARFFAFISYTFNPEVIYVGGGISSNMNFLNRLKSEVQKELTNYGVEKIMPVVKQARNAGDAGIYGAMSLFLER